MGFKQCTKGGAFTHIMSARDHQILLVIPKSGCGAPPLELNSPIEVFFGVYFCFGTHSPTL